MVCLFYFILLLFYSFVIYFVVWSFSIKIPSYTFLQSWLSVTKNTIRGASRWLKLKYNTNIYLLWVPFKDYSGFSLRRHFALNVEIDLSILFVFTIRHKHCVVINFNMTHKKFSCQKKICLDCDAYIQCVCIRFQQCKV